MKTATLKINKLLIACSIILFTICITIKANSQVLSFETVKSNRKNSQSNHVFNRRRNCGQD